MATEPASVDLLAQHPISAVQWIPPETLTSNEYNPNKVAPPELELLRESILADGFTQPIVITPDGIIVDGFHRWTLGLRDDAIRAATGGLVPVVTARRVGEHERIAATIRHNRARGTHGVKLMAKIVQHMKDTLGMTDEQVSHDLGMELEEVDRLYDRAGMTIRGSRDADQFSKGWQPGEKPEDAPGYETPKRRKRRDP